GKELFENLFQRIDIYNELISHLKKNKQERSKDILNVPDFDISEEIKNALLKTKKNYPKLIQKLLSNKEEFVELRKELFPTGKNLKGL
ncbi:restriction endonuclease, partial [Campylobacter jejuni]|nr:restriction endonuclease [Campylobacter jejuni]